MTEGVAGDSKIKHSWMDSKGAIENACAKNWKIFTYPAHELKKTMCNVFLKDVTSVFSIKVKNGVKIKILNYSLTVTMN